MFNRENDNLTEGPQGVNRGVGILFQYCLV